MRIKKLSWSRRRKLPAADKLYEQFNERCGEQPCEECRFSYHPATETESECALRFVQALTTGRMAFGDSFHKDKINPESTPLPEWCKVNTWITATNIRDTLGKITQVDPTAGTFQVKWVRAARTAPTTVRVSNAYTPVRFREYTKAESHKLIGKTMKWEHEGFTYSEMITRIKTGYSCVTGTDCCWDYNQYSFSDLQSWNATVDGVPIGVPEIIS